jgi:hypothetical protein
LPYPAGDERDTRGDEPARRIDPVLLASAALVAIFGPVTMLLYRSRQ